MYLDVNLVPYNARGTSFLYCDNIIYLEGIKHIIHHIPEVQDPDGYGGNTLHC